MATATEKKRIKMRGNRKSIEDIHMGPEPSYNENSSMTSSDWIRGANWYNYFWSAKDFQKCILTYVEELGYTKEETNSLKKLTDWELGSRIKTIIKLTERGFVHKPEQLEAVNEEIKLKIDLAKTRVAEIKDAKASAKPVITIQQRMKQKMYSTIYEDWDFVVDGWIAGEFNRTIDTYALFKQYDLKGATITMFGDVVRGEYDVVSDAVNKTCDQAVEGYSHITTANLKKMMKTMEGIFADLDRLKNAAKAARIPRAKKPKASDAQIIKLNYCNSDITSKLHSINPVMIPGASRLYVYNIKTRKYTMYTSDSTSGFEVRGSTLYNWDENSKITTLRKPDEVLPLILNKTAFQLDKLWKTFTTKINKPNGRINKDCILLRVER
jgi:hypothetical protein